MFTNNKSVSACMHYTVLRILSVSSVGVGQLLSHSTASLAAHADVNNPVGTNSCLPDSHNPSFHCSPVLPCFKL